MKDWQFSLIIILLATILAGVLYLVNSQIVGFTTTSDTIEKAVQKGVQEALDHYDISN